MGAVVLTVGMSPLPVCQAIVTLKPDSITMVHGTGDSESCAQRVKQFCTDAPMNMRAEDVRLIPVAPFTTRDVTEGLQIELAKNPGVLTGELVYGPGTTPQNVVTYATWLTQSDNVDNECWYVSLDGSLVPQYRTGVKRLEATGLDLEGLIKLHMPDDFSLNMPPKVALPANKLREAAKYVEPWLYQGKSIDELPGARKVMTSFGLSTRKQGDSLESSIALFMLARYGTRVEVRINVEFVATVEHVDNGGEGQSKASEVDVVVRSSDRTVIVSCGRVKDPSERRRKSLEVRSHAPKIGGSEARTLTVGWVVDEDNNERRQKLAANTRTLLNIDAEPKSMIRDIYADASELLGDDPFKTLCNGGNGAGQAKWLLEWLDWNLRDTSQAPSVI